MNVPLAKCYGSSCTCAKGYVYDQIKKLCQLQNIAVPASDVHCDLAHGSQCGFNAKCIYDPEHDGSICHCNPGFYGDGFECEYFGLNVNSGECKRHSQCLNSEKCVMIFDDRSTFTFSCVKKDPKEIIGG